MGKNSSGTGREEKYCFFSTLYQNRADLFEDLEIWKDPRYRRLQGSRPAIFFTFAAVKSPSYDRALSAIGNYMEEAYRAHQYLCVGNSLMPEDKKQFSDNMHTLRYRHDEEICIRAMKDLCMFLEQYHGKKVLLFIDEYDTPLQEAFFYGYWDQMIVFMREFFNTTLKSNLHLEKAFRENIVFQGLIKRWFEKGGDSYRCFCKYLLDDDTEKMNDYLSDLLRDLCSFFDMEGLSAEKAPERFYHGLVPGLLVDLSDRYEITSCESGYGRYDIMMRPRCAEQNAMIIEFKTRKKRGKEIWREPRRMP